MALILLNLSGCGKRIFGFNFGDREEVIVSEIGFEYLSTRTKFKYKNGNDKTKATARMRIKKDSIIWFSLTPGVGIEAARGIITQDSLILMDRVHKEAYYFSFDSLRRKFDLDFSFDLFQSVLIGDLPYAQGDHFRQRDGHGRAGTSSSKKPDGGSEKLYPFYRLPGGRHPRRSHARWRRYD